MSSRAENSIKLFKNARVFSGRGRGDPVWAEAVLVHGDKIEAVGSEGELATISRGAEFFDLQGALMLPGLCDAHMHMAAGGLSLSIPDLSHKQLREIEHTLRDAAARMAEDESAWLVAFNWDEDCCSLNADLLENWVPNRPVIVHKRDLHGCCCNRTALKRVGLGSDRKELPGGRIGRLPNGAPNGMLYEAAVKIVQDARPRPSNAVRREHILAAQEYLLSLGLTAVSEVLDAESLQLYRELDAEQQLRLEIDGWQRIEHWDGSPPISEGDHFRTETIKVFLDGAFGSKTAALFEPFSDTGDNSGMLLYSDEELLDICRRATSTGWRMAMHAIGDRAVDQACRILSRSARPTKGMHRIEHMQLLPENGVGCVARSGAAGSIQPVHLLDDQVWLPERIGLERCRRSFVWRSLIDRGVTLAIGSDWPVASPDPLLNMQTAVNRANFGQPRHAAFNADEAMTPVEAIRSASLAWAAVTGSEDRRGVIAPGIQADFTILSGIGENLGLLDRAAVKLTVCRGQVVYNV